MPDLLSLEVGFLSRVSPATQKKLIDNSQLFRFSKGDVIFHEGNPSMYLYLLASGRVALDFGLRGGSLVAFTTVDAGEVFSWSALSDSRVETATARALTEVEAYGIKGGVLDDLCLEDPKIGLELYRALCEVVSSRLTATRSHLLDIFGSPKFEPAFSGKSRSGGRIGEWRPI